MPAQTTSPEVAYYEVGDTAPDFSVFLEDGAGNRIDLTGATVTIDLAYASGSHYYSPYGRILSDDACTVDPDQTASGNRGLVHWTPNSLVVGSFHARFHIAYGGGGRQTIPPEGGGFPIIVSERAGGS